MRTSLVLLIVTLVGTTGCIGNMGELKEALGVTAPPPVYAPPEARAQANVTSVVTGAPVKFTSEGSRDPQGLGLWYSWRVGERTLAGAEVTHAFAQPGEWRVTLNVTNEAGLSDEATLVVQVAQANRPPLASIAVQDASGRPADAGERGVPLQFVALGSTDPDGDALAYEWDFGDGGTSHDAKASRAFDKPGLHVVRLRVTDAAGLSATASRLVAVHATHELKGAFEPAGASAQRHALEIPEAAATMRATLTFPAALGGNDLTLVVRDAAGREVGRTQPGTEPGTQGDELRDLLLAGEALRPFAPGPWTFEVTREKGVQVSYALVVRVEM